MMLHQLKSEITREERNKLNENFNIIENSLGGLRSQINNIVASAGEENSENVAARTNTNQNITYVSVGDRLDSEYQTVTKEIAKKVDLTYFDMIIASLVDGGPRELFYSVATLQSTYPNGEVGTYLVFDSAFLDGAHTFMWNGSAWQDLGVYQANGIANESVTTVKLANDAVTTDKIDFATTGVNLLDFSRMISGFYVHSTSGQLVASTTNKVSPLLPIKSATTYHLTSASCIVFFYDTNGTPISGIANGTGRVFTTPQNAKFYRISFANTFNFFMVAEGAELLPYEPYKIKMPALELTPSNVPELNRKINLLIDLQDLEPGGKNILNESQLQLGYVQTTTGNVFASETNRVSKIIPIAENNTHLSLTSGSCNLVFYDANGVYISGSVPSPNRTVVIPQNARYFRISFANTFNFFMVEYGEVPTQYEKFKHIYSNLELQPFNFKDKTIPLSALDGEISSISPNRMPIGRAAETLYQPNNNTTISTIFVAENGDIYAIRWDNKIIKNTDVANNVWSIVVDVAPYLNAGETLNGGALVVTNTKRIIVSTKENSTKKGRVLRSDEAQTTFEEAFAYKNGVTINTWGYECKNNIVLFCAYLIGKDAQNQGTEVFLSTDYGANFNRIFDKNIEDMENSADYHLHDVAFDQYSNAIIFVEGDTVNNQINYSYDFGETFTPVNATGTAVIHPTSILPLPHTIAFGSDDRPEGIWSWERPSSTNVNPPILNADIKPVATFNVGASTLGNIGVKGHSLLYNGQMYGVIGFVNHGTEVPGHPRLFATGDGGKSWHEIWKATRADDNGFKNAFLRIENNELYIYSCYVYGGAGYVWKAKMPEFINV